MLVFKGLRPKWAVEAKVDPHGGPGWVRVSVGKRLDGCRDLADIPYGTPSGFFWVRSQPMIAPAF